MASRAVDEARRRGGVAGRAAVVGATSAEALDWAARAGRLVRALPRTYLLPDELESWPSRCRAATEYAGPGAAVSHLSALRLWGLPVPETGAVDVVVDHARRPRAGATAPVPVRVHRTRRPRRTWQREGLPVVPLEEAVVASWPLLQQDAQRALALVAVQRRLTTPGRLAAELARHPRLPGRAALCHLVGLLEAGCTSELELWGHQVVFTGARFSTWRWQAPLSVRGRSVVLDLFDDEALLAVELDGRAYHDGPQQRERDLARDALVAEAGVVTLRFPHRRLSIDPEGCREQAWRVSVVRRRQLRGER
ncbi:DUF559 domain-containing protein [Pseudokineococcus sp. 5B2Z-1]|uniref:DUF559 domain-containing protein n=1 Tax=Pseudokineococcus sp. 5B2Z-1 TaxID=3132744 RepID=UPI00309DEBB2